MQITVFGASGRVGRQAVHEALARGHTVVGFVHSNTNFESDDRLRLYQGDIHDADAVAQSLQGSQAVISALGSWGTRTKDIVASATRAIIPAMQAQNISRIVSLTGTEAYASSDIKPSLLRKAAHAAAAVAAAKILRDGEDHIQLLEACDLDWTVIRSPAMTNSPRSAYKLTLTVKPPWQTIPRRAVAKALIDQVEGPGYLREAPFIYRQ